jgi:DNA-directed RNA polymerase specialized sigma24 family protein
MDRRRPDEQAGLTVLVLDDPVERADRDFRFSGGATIRIGRGDENDVQVSHPKVSRCHLVIHGHADRWECSSVGRYGTYLSGRSIQHVVLTDEMILQLTHGGPRLQFQTTAAVDRSLDDGRPVTVWMEHLEQGSQHAATHLWQEYFQRVVSLARSRLQLSHRRMADDEDIAVSVFDSVFSGITNGRFPDLDSRDSLWRLLCVVTRRKVVDRVQYDLRQKRGGGQVHGESVPGDCETGTFGLEQAPALVAAPEFAFRLAVEIDDLFHALQDPELREVARLMLEGCTIEEVAAARNCSARTIQRRLQMVREVLSERLRQAD